MKRFERTEDEQKINNRISKRLQHLSDLLHYYMVSPKDAFRNVTLFFSLVEQPSHQLYVI